MNIVYMERKSSLQLSISPTSISFLHISFWGLFPRHVFHHGFLLAFREILLFSLVENSVSDRVHLTARQESQGGGSLGAIPLCVASAEGTLFTETSGILPTAGCSGAPGLRLGLLGVLVQALLEVHSRH